VIRSAQDQPGSRVINARIMYEGLRRTASMRSPRPPKDPEKTPLVFISAECPQLISAIPMLIADEDKPDDVLKLETVADDCFDAAKYLLAEWLSVKDQAPREVRRAEAMDNAAHEAAQRRYVEPVDLRAAENTARYMRMLKFDDEEHQQERRGRRR
jgi:hypothetical protein